MRYLTPAQILLIHSMVIDETGGSHGVRDEAVILRLNDAPRQRAFGRELYPSISHKAAVYARDIIRNHPFLDGNKRAGMATAAVFLEDNGYRIRVQEGEIEEFALKIAREQLDIEAIAAWLQQHARELPLRERRRL